MDLAEDVMFDRQIAVIGHEKLQTDRQTDR